VIYQKTKQFSYYDVLS